MIAQIIAAALLIVTLAWCVIQLFTALETRNRVAALSASLNGVCMVAWAGLLAWGGFW